MIKIDSINIDAAEYIRGDMTVRMVNGNTYRYFDVPEELFEGLCKSDNAGKCLAENIKGKYRYCAIDYDGDKEVISIKELLLHRDSTIGLFCIDQDPKDVDYEWIKRNAFQLKE